MNHGNCVFCGNSVYQGDEVISLFIGVAHLECHEDYKADMEADMREMAEEESSRARKDNRLLARLRRTLKPKIWMPIERVLADNFCHSLSIVKLDDVSGQRVNAHDWFGESVAIRHLYDDTSHCSYSDSSGGVVYLPIGKQRYLQMEIHS